MCKSAGDRIFFYKMRHVCETKYPRQFIRPNISISYISTLNIALWIKQDAIKYWPMHDGNAKFPRWTFRLGIKNVLKLYAYCFCPVCMSVCCHIHIWKHTPLMKPFFNHTNVNDLDLYAKIILWKFVATGGILFHKHIMFLNL